MDTTRHTVLEYRAASKSNDGGFRFRVSGFGFPISDFRLPVWVEASVEREDLGGSGFGFPVSGDGDSLYVRLSGGGCW